MECLFCGIGHYWLLTVKLLFAKVVHHLSHTRLAAHTYNTEALALSIGSVFVELHFEEIGDSEILNIVLNVLICCPPSQVPNVQLPLPSILATA